MSAVGGHRGEGPRQAHEPRRAEGPRKAHEPRRAPVSRALAGEFAALRAAWPAYLTLAVIGVAAILLRFWDLGTNPGGLYGDEAAEGLDAWRLLNQPGFHADWGVWFTTDGGREALFAYVVAAVFHFAGPSVLALRATAAAIGVAGVLMIGHVGRRFGIWVGVAAAAWAAGSLWLVAVSRDGMRNAIVPLFGAVAIYALLRWADRPGRGSAAVAGALTSLAALYTYQPLKLLPLIVVVWLWWLRRSGSRTYPPLRATVRPFVAAFLIVAAPMALVAVTNPTNYFGRVAWTSPFNPWLTTDTDPITHTIRTLLMFGLTGDPNGRHDVAQIPLLPLPLGVVAAAGLWRLWRARRDPGHSLILLSLPIFLAAPLFALDGQSPHFLRALGLATPLGLTIGLGCLELVEQTRRRAGVAAGRLAGGVLAATLTALAVWSGWAYLSRPPADRYAAFSYSVSSLSSYAADHPGTAVILDPHSAMDVEFLDAAAGRPLPPIVTPGSKPADPTIHLYLAIGLDDVRSTLGSEAVGRAVPVAWDPAGNPTVWAVGP